MKTLIFLVFAVFLITCVSSLSVTNLLFKHKYRRIGVDQIIDAIILEVYFDDKLYLKSGNGTITQFTSHNFTWDFLNTTTTPAKNTSIPICMGRSYAVCPVLPPGLANIAGSFMLECPNNKTVTSRPNSLDYIYYQSGSGANNLDFLIPMPPAEEPFTAFNYELRWVNNTNGNKWDIVENKLSFMILNAFTYSNTKYIFKTRPTVDDISQCRLKINSSSITNYTITDQSGNAPQGFNTTAPKQSVPGNYCNSDVIIEAKNTLVNITNNLKSSRRWAILVDGLWHSAMFMLSEKLENCTYLLDQKLISQTKTSSYPISYCVHPTQTPEWLNDTCCNPLYFWSDRCCHKKNVSITLETYSPPTNDFASTCSSPDRTNFLLQDYTTLVNLAADPTLGCSVSTEQYKYNVINGQFLDLFSCYNDIYAGLAKCSNDSDCPCSRCELISGTCYVCPTIPKEDAMEACFIQRLPNSIVGQARADWGLIDADNTTFFNEFFNRVKQPVCLSYLGIVQTTLNSTSCELLGSCKNVTNPLYYRSMRNSSCVVNNFTGVCEICTARGTCTKLPLGAHCISGDDIFNADSDLCNYIGGSWNNYESTCFYPYAKAQCQCYTGSDNNTLCNTGYCYDYTVDESTCIYDSSVDPAYKYWDPLLEHCIVKMSFINDCVGYANYDWRFGRKWKDQKINVTTQSDCQNLNLCQIGKELVNGSACDTSTQCIGLCPTCESSIGSPSSACVSPNITDVDTCLNATGWWQVEDLTCIFLYDQATCLANNLIWETCGQLNYSTCGVCANYENGCPLKSKFTLDCTWTYNHPCNTSLPKEQCEQQQYCYDMKNYPGCAYSVSTIDSRLCPICSWNFRNQRANETSSNSTRSYEDKFEVMPSRHRKQQERLEIHSKKNYELLRKKLDPEEFRVLQTREYKYNFDPILKARASRGFESGGRGERHLTLHENNFARQEEEFDEDYEVIGYPSDKNKRGIVFSNFVSSLDLYSVHGCLTTSVTKSDCLRVGAKWIEPLQTKEDCLASKGCRESLGNNGCIYNANADFATIDFATNKTEQECVDCGGSYQSLNQWRVSSSVPVTKYTATWKTTPWEPSNTFIPYISANSLRNNLERYLFTSTSYAVSTSVDCETQPVFQTVQYYDCDCTTFANGTKKPEGFCYTSKFVVTTGSQLFCRGDQKSVRIGNALVNMTRESVSISNFCIEMSFGTIGASQFKSDQKVISSSALLSSLTKKDNPYAIITNRFGFVVGQLLSDGVSITVKLALSNTTNNSTQLRATEVNNFTICLDARSDIQNSASDFPLIDFATASNDYKTFSPMNLTGITFNGKQYCGSIVTSTSKVFPVSLTRDWATRNSIFAGKEAIRNAIYFLSAAMFVLFVFCLIAIIIHFIETRLDFSLTKTCLCLLLVYSGLRAAFFLLFALEKLTSISNDSPAGFFVLAELPYYVFLSIFIFLVIFWARISKNSSANILKKMIIPVAILNIILYLFFVIVVIIAATVKGDGVTILNKVYKCIICFIAACIIVTSWIFGGLVLKRSFKGMRIRGDSGKKIPSYLIKTSVILFITSFAMLFQVVYLLYITFKSNTSVNLALAVYFLVEVVPAVCLFILFAPIKMERAGLTRSSRNSKKSTTNNSKKSGDVSMKSVKSNETPYEN
eukprot:TRINITY_DN2969_c0_g2_i2.p1 TRINITY_DN2969_c0_g2~~TRINITY_DN2969_c0_g2_i2.p1  ORF type:complete len:1647 (-),score=329.46 TRINITY_DN2969_c0_g2_i2:19-4959(-)